MLNARTILQNAYMVNDLDAAIERWHRVFQPGPFFVTRHVQVGDLRYRGAPADLDFSIAIAQAGDVQVELVQQHCDNPSAFRDMYAPGQTGLHHVAIFADDYDADLARFRAEGCLPVTEGIFGGARFSYIDASAPLGVYIEMLEENAGIRQFFGKIKSAADDPRHEGSAIYGAG